MEKPVWLSKINWVAAITFAIGVLTLAMDQEWTTADVDKFLLAAIGALNFVLRTWFTTMAVTFQPPTRLLVGLAVLLVPGSLYAEDVTIKITGVTRGQSYEMAYNADGSVVIKPITTVAVGGVVPPPTVPPTTNPTMAAQVQTLTRAALQEGGSLNTSISLSAVYSVVASQVDSGTLPLASIGPALKELSEFVIPTTEKAAWDKWRAGVAVLMAGKLDTKANAVSTLRTISDWTKASTTAMAAIRGDAIDWQKLFELLLPILLQLLAKFLNPMAM